MAAVTTAGMIPRVGLPTHRGIPRTGARFWELAQGTLRELRRELQERRASLASSGREWECLHLGSVAIPAVIGGYVPGFWLGNSLDFNLGLCVVGIKFNFPIQM